MVQPLGTCSAQDLMTDPAVEGLMLIEGLMGGGLGFLCASPKAGKSWLAMEVSICVATGKPLWCYEVQRGCVLHIPLEGTYERLRRRLWLIADEVDGNLFFATRAEGLGGGLLDQLAMFHGDHPDLGLVVIDTMQIVRSTTRDYSYSSDYRELSELERFADDHGITVLLIHHTRKMGDSDVMNTVSGTNAVTGAADFTWVLTKDRNSADAELTVTGRDIEQRKLDLTFEDRQWKLVKDSSMEEIAAARIPVCVSQVVDFTRQNGTWEGQTSELLAEIGSGDVSVASFGKFLAQHSAHLEKNGIRYSKRRTMAGSRITLELLADDYDGNGSYGSDSQGHDLLPQLSLLPYE